MPEGNVYRHGQTASATALILGAEGRDRLVTKLSGKDDKTGCIPARRSSTISGTMPVHKSIRFLIVAAVILAVPSVCLACDYGYMAVSELYTQADAVFVGKVIESPWKAAANGTVATTGRTSVRLSVQSWYKGTALTEVKLAMGMGMCQFPFLEGETYLVHAFQKNGALDTGAPWRPLLISGATEALKYIDAIRNSRPIGVIHGSFLLRARNGELASIPSTSNFSVRFQSGGNNLQIKTSPNRYQEFAVPPGEYQAWLELDGKIVSDKRPIRVFQGKAAPANLEGKLDR
jgi:hypothetical protein